MKKIISILVLSLFCLTYFTGCLKNNNIDKENIKVDSSLKINQIYNSVKDLKENSFDMVEVNVKSTESVMYKELGVTISTVKVKSSLKGKFKSGEQIRIIETGGKYKYTGNDSKIKHDQLIEQVCDGIPVMESSERYILFINKYEGEVTKNAYKILGVYQGKFKVDNDIVVQKSPEKYKIRDFTLENVDKFKQRINELK